MTQEQAHTQGKTFKVIYQGQPHKNRSFKVRGICQYDVLNPCWDNRPSDIPGLHWADDGYGTCKACPACTSAAKQH